MREINKLFIHCADTYPDMDIGVGTIRKWHVDRGWSDIGYHWVIRRSGRLEAGRPPDREGAHAFGHNKDSLAICLVGGKGDDGKPETNFTAAQWETLADTVGTLTQVYNIKRVMGHNEVSTKACPTFNVEAWMRDTLE